jgi:cell division protein FtsB
MLNVSATQQLAKIINEQQKQIELLKKQNADIAKENEKLKDTQLTTKATVDTILARLLQMETNKAGANQPVVASVNQ